MPVPRLLRRFHKNWILYGTKEDFAVMARFLHQSSPGFFRKYAATFLALLWLFGLLLGAAAFRGSEGVLVSLMGPAVVCRVSIVSLLIPVFLPFLFAALAVYLSHSGLLAVVCFLKAACFSFVSCGAAACYGSAGWLIWILLMFHDIGGCILLYWYALRHISSARGFSLGELALFLLAGSFFAMAECRFFAPLLAQIVYF